MSCPASSERRSDIQEAKGPAEVAASPSHGPNNPEQEKAMDFRSDTTEAARPASGSKAHLRWADQYPAEVARIQALSMAELMGMTAGMTAAIDGFLSIANQPRCSGADHDWITHEMERLSCVRDMVFAEMEHRPATSDDDSEERIRIIVAYELAEAGVDIMEAIEKLARLKGDYDQARFAAALKRRAA
jgi:hypothetical protein